MRTSVSLILISAVLLLAGCGRGRTALRLEEGDTLRLRHASNLTLVQYDSCAVALLRNPWDTTQTLHTYVLVPRDTPLPRRLPEGTLVRTPLRRAAVYSSVHCSLLEQLGMLDAIGGVCDLKYIKMDRLQARVRQGLVQDYGSGLNPNLEKIMDTHPDALMPSPFENSGGYGRLEKLGIPIIECADYMETSALGRAEWMRFYGRLFGCPERADSLFEAVERRYLALAAQTRKVNKRPTLLCETLYGASWHVAGGRSTLGKLYRDAGADYLFAGYPESGSVPLPFETVFDRAQDADVWLIKYNQPQELTYDQLRSDYAPYARFRPFRKRRIYGCNTQHVRFYEEVQFQPDRLLADLIKIFHPDLLPSYNLHYFCPLK